MAPPAVPLRARGRRRHVRPLPAPSAVRPGTSANRPARRVLRGHESVAAAPGQPGRKGLERGPGTPAEPRRRRPAAPSGKAERVPGSLGLGAAAAATAPARSPARGGVRGGTRGAGAGRGLRGSARRASGHFVGHRPESVRAFMLRLWCERQTAPGRGPPMVFFKIYAS